MYSSIYVGSSKIKEVYLGSNRIWKGTVEAGYVKFLESTVWTVPEGVKTIDVFLVGGGAGGCTNSPRKNQFNYGGGQGGSGGFTKTVLNYSVTPLSKINVVVGAGGKAHGYMATDNGGDSSFGDITVKGGIGFSYPSPYDTYYGSGGSGGGDGAGGISRDSYGNGDLIGACKGGIDGANGGYAIKGSYDNIKFMQEGQGTTTREFGESTGKLYASGGGGGGYYQTGAYVYSFPPAEMVEGTGAANTGGGGQGITLSFNDYTDVASTKYSATDGYSGIVIVRWKEQ